MEVIIRRPFYFGGNNFQDFRSNKSKSGSSIIIAYLWPMTLKVGYGSGVVTAMNLRGKLGKLRVPLNITNPYYREVFWVISNFMCKKGYFEFVNVLQYMNF